MKLKSKAKISVQQIKLIPQTHNNNNTLPKSSTNNKYNKKYQQIDDFTKLDLQSTTKKNFNHEQLNKFKQVSIMEKKKENMKKKVQQLENNIYFSIVNGQTLVNEQPKQLKNKQVQSQAQKQEALTLRQKIDLLNGDLLNLRQSIASQKMLEKKYHQQKQKEASQLVHRLKIQKHQFKKKLKFIDVQHRVKDQAFSQSIIKMMKAQTQRKLQRKKQELEDRIEAINKRKDQRIQNAHQNEDEYMEKLKKMEEFKEKRIFSTSKLVLPKLTTIQTLNVQNQKQQQNSEKALDNPLLKSKATDWFQIKQHNKQYQSKIKKLALYKHSHSKSEAVLQNEKLQNIYGKRKDRKQRYDQGNKMLQQSLKILKPETSPKKIKQRTSLHDLLLEQNKSKQKGNMYMKQSLQKARAYKSRQKSAIQNKSNVTIDIQQTIQLKANYLPIVRNQKLQQLLDKYDNTLKEMKIEKIDKMKGLYILAIVEKKLDRLDPQGITQRLTRKLQVLQQSQQKQKFKKNNNYKNRSLDLNNEDNQFIKNSQNEKQIQIVNIQNYNNQNKRNNQQKSIQKQQNEKYKQKQDDIIKIY